MRILNTVHPTTYQKRVIAIIASAPNAKLAAEQVSGDQNLIAARDMLARLGVLTYDQQHAELTQKGHDIAQSENIVDASGQLTPDGQQLVAPTNQPPEPAPAPAAPGVEPPVNQPPAGDDLNLESFVLLKELLNI